MILTSGQEVIVSRFRDGHDLLEAIEATAYEAKVDSGLFWLIGALRKATLGFYTGKGRFKPTKISRILEITSCIGNIAHDGDKTIVHGHLTVTDSHGRAFGGHLLKGCEIYTNGELMILKVEEGKLRRKFDQASGLRLLQT